MAKGRSVDMTKESSVRTRIEGEVQYKKLLSSLKMGHECESFPPILCDQ